MTEHAIQHYVQTNAARFLEELKEWVAIPSVSTLPEHRADMQQAAEWIAAKIEAAIGVPAELITVGEGHPLVYAEWLGAPGQPTVLIYGHYDVQPVDPLELWRTPPFEPVVEGDNLRGRGAVDDKGPTFATIKALETLTAVEGGLPVNLKILLEGEEECGGESIAAFVTQNPAKLVADCALTLDTGMVEPGVPTLTYALRGMTYFELIANGAQGDLHSGMFGGIAPNPIQALCWVLAELKGRDGWINLPGLYELIQPLSAAEQQMFEQRALAEAHRMMEVAGLSELPGEAGYNVIERSTARPTFEVHGIRGGFIGEGGKTVIPATATAKCSLRLVANQTPGVVLDMVRRRVAELAVPGITLEVRDLHGGDPVTFDLNAAPIQAASSALEAEFGRSIAFDRSGGSIPVAALFHSVLAMPAVMMGFGLADDNVHAPNEKFYLPNFYAAIRSVAGFLQRMQVNA
jgi:acetylornithine deacetylase/succinyl-diaminopimelate desuccinylase-like protein